MRLEARRLHAPAGDVQRLGRDGGDDASARAAVVGVGEQGAASLVGGDPRLERLRPLVRLRDPALGEALLDLGALLAGQRRRVAAGLLGRDLEQRGVVVVVAEERQRLRPPSSSLST
jgi:hypothetical protein